MRTFFRFTLPPLTPVAILVALAGFAVWHIQHSPFEHLPDGHIDNDPELAAGAIILLSPLIYLVLFALHALALYMARLFQMGPFPLWVSVIILSTCALVAWSVYHRPLEDTMLQKTGFAFVLSVILFVPLGISSVLLTRTPKLKQI